MTPRILIAFLFACFMFAAPAGATGGHDFCRAVKSCVPDRCEEPVPTPEPPKVNGYGWFFYPAKNAKCDPADESTRRAFLCYERSDGTRERWKMLRWTPMQEAQFEADLRNAAQGIEQD